MGFQGISAMSGPRFGAVVIFKTPVKDEIEKNHAAGEFLTNLTGLILNHPDTFVKSEKDATLIYARRDSEGEKALRALKNGAVWLEGSTYNPTAIELETFQEDLFVTKARLPEKQLKKWRFTDAQATLLTNLIKAVSLRWQAGGTEGASNEEIQKVLTA